MTGDAFAKVAPESELDVVRVSGRPVGEDVGACQSEEDHREPEPDFFGAQRGFERFSCEAGNGDGGQKSEACGEETAGEDCREWDADGA